MEELINLVHLLILALEMEEEWLLELDYLLKIQNLCNFIQQVFTEQDV
jgi:hypothetical protein